MYQFITKVFGGGALFTALAVAAPQQADAQIVIGRGGVRMNDWSSRNWSGYRSPRYYGSGRMYYRQHGYYSGSPYYRSSYYRSPYYSSPYYGSPYYCTRFYRGNAVQVGPVQIYGR